MLEHGCAFHILKSSVFIDLKSAFDLVGRAILWRCLSLKDVPEEIISLSYSSYANARIRFRVHLENWWK